MTIKKTVLALAVLAGMGVSGQALAFSAGTGAVATGANSTAVGDSAQATGDYTAAFGGGAVASGSLSTALGQSADATGSWSVAAGQNAQATGDYTAAFGGGSVSSQTSSTALGVASQATAVNATAVGQGAVASGSSSVALGQSADATGSGSVALGYASGDDGRTNVVSVGNSTITRQIIYVGDGAVSGSSTDAVNGRQLYQTNVDVMTAQTTADQALALGDNSAQYDADGNLAMNTTTAAVVDVDGNPVLDVDGNAQYETVYSSRITGLAGGIDAHDAANMQQVWAGDAMTLQSANTYTDKGVAAAMAMPGVRIEPGKSQGLNLALGHYGSATAVGATYGRNMKNGQLELSGSYADGGDFGARVAYGFSW